MGELVAKADDLWCLIDLGKSILVALRKLIECLTEDRELPLNRRANQAAVAEIIEVDASDGLLDGVTRLDLAEHVGVAYGIGHHQIHWLAGDRGQLLLKAEPNRCMRRTWCFWQAAAMASSWGWGRG